MARPVNRPYAMRHALLILSVVWAGCVGEPEPDQSEVRSAIDGDDPSFDFELSWVPSQGNYMLGSFPDGLADGPNYISVSLEPANRPEYRLSVTASSAGANLVADRTLPRDHHEGHDNWFVGMTLTASNGGRLTIRDVGTPDPSHVDVEGVVPQPTSALYALDYSRKLPDGSYAPPVDYCGGRGGAIVLAGVFDRTRTHREANAISFACANGIALKCVFWGYNPGNGGPSSPGWRYHQSCTGMGLATYCQNGTSYTRELTPVAVRDELDNYGSDGLYELKQPETLPGNPDAFYIEGGWDEHGWPICLSQSRWAALKPDLCGPPGSSNPKPPLCEGVSMTQLFDQGALIVNGATTMDAPLMRWQNPETKDVVLTIRGYFRAAGPNSPQLIAPPFDGYTTYLGVHGMLMRNLPGVLPINLMRPIYMQNLAGGDRYLSDALGPPGSFEGYAFRNEDTTTPDLSVLNLPAFSECKRPSGNRDSGVEGFMAGCTLDTPPNSLGFALPPP
jgi:hypothetical protein